MRTRLLRTILVAALALAIVATACVSGEGTSISSDNGHINIGQLCARMEMMRFEDEQLRTDLLLVFACEEVWR